MDTTSIRAGAMFANAQGRTVKIDDLNKDMVSYYVDGNSSRQSSKLTDVTKMLEGGGYKDITQALSSFYLAGTDPHGIGAKLLSQDGGYVAEIIKKDKSGIHVKFADRNNSKNSSIYIYETSDFNFKEVFNPELINELNTKFTNSVFEVIGENSKHEDVKFTVLGKSVNKDLLEKINKSYGDLSIYQVKRLTNITLQ